MIFGAQPRVAVPQVAQALLPAFSASLKKCRNSIFDPYGVEYSAPLVRRFHPRLMILFPFGELRGLCLSPSRPHIEKFGLIWSPKFWLEGSN